MIGAIGIALEHDVLRVVHRERGKIVATEISWDAANPELAIETLNSQLGKPRTIALSIGLGFLEVARPELPALAAADRLRVLRRDADRYFPIEGAAAVSGAHAGGVAFALPANQLQLWISAFGSWAPVRSVVAAPNSIANALSARGTMSSSFSIDAGANECGVIRFANGMIEEARRIPLSVAPGVVNGTRPIDDRVIDETPGRFTAAIGALESRTAPLETMLLDATLYQTLRTHLERRAWASYAMFAAMIVLLVTAANLHGEKALLESQRSVDSLAVRGAPSVAALARLTSLDNEVRSLVARQATRTDALSVLAALSKALPADAFVERIDGNGGEWRIDGSANQAATIVPQLDATGVFGNVRALSASTRFRDGSHMRESFSVGFQIKGEANVKR